MSLGICDWGIGGLGLYEMLKRSRPDVSVTYIADHGSTPYSLLSKPELEERVRQILLTFRRLGVHQVVFASDAASTTLSDVSVAGVKSIGLIEPTLRSMRTRRYREVGVIGGRRTILSGAYGRALRKQRFCVLQRMSLDLSQAIENGSAEEPETREMLEALLEPLIKVDGLLLASTHYRLVAPIIQDILPGAELIDPIEETVAEILKGLAAPEVPFGEDTFYTTGDPATMSDRASKQFGLNLEAKLVDLAAHQLVA